MEYLIFILTFLFFSLIFSETLENKINKIEKRLDSIEEKLDKLIEENNQKSSNTFNLADLLKDVRNEVNENSYTTGAVFDLSGGRATY